MEEEQKDTLCGQLGIIDESLGFLLIIVASVLLSLWSVVIQRKGLCLTIRGEPGAAGDLPDVYPIKRKAGAMVIGALGFFLCLALDTWNKAGAGKDAAAFHSAGTNLWASLLVLIAAILRFQDLELTERCGGQPQSEDSTLPD